MNAHHWALYTVNALVTYIYTGVLLCQKHTQPSWELLEYNDDTAEPDYDGGDPPTNPKKLFGQVASCPSRVATCLATFHCWAHLGPSTADVRDIWLCIVRATTATTLESMHRFSLVGLRAAQLCYGGGPSSCSSVLFRAFKCHFSVFFLSIASFAQCLCQNLRHCFLVWADPNWIVDRHSTSHLQKAQRMAFGPTQVAWLTEFTVTGRGTNRYVCICLFVKVFFMDGRTRSCELALIASL